VADVCCLLRCVSMSELERVADLADRLASRVLESVERGTLSADELRENPDVGGKHAARVTVVDHVFDAASGTIGIRLEIPNPEFSLPAGLKCQVRFFGVG
jgi:hypothetical protein